jgi:hypothetical protein
VPSLATTLKTQSYGWLALCFLGNAALEILDYARGKPAIRTSWPLVSGSGPNFVAVFAIAGALVSVVLLSPMGPLRQMHPARRVNGALLFTLLGLLLWEAVQPYTAHGVFDWHDVAATIIASAGTALIWPYVPVLRLPDGDSALPVDKG